MPLSAVVGMFCDKRYLRGLTSFAMVRNISRLGPGRRRGVLLGSKKSVAKVLAGSGWGATGAAFGAGAASVAGAAASADFVFFNFLALGLAGASVGVSVGVAAASAASTGATAGASDWAGADAGASIWICSGVAGAGSAWAGG